MSAAAKLQNSLRTATLSTAVTRQCRVCTRLPSLQVSSITTRNAAFQQRTINRPIHTNSSSNLNTQHQQRQQRSASPSEPDLTPSFSFKDLGASKTVKVVVVALIVVFGTMESVMWWKVGWRWYMGEPDPAEKSDGVSE